jgi:SpoU rRNA Methylase family
MFSIILYEPEIPPNTGNIIRLAANTGASLHLVEPAGAFVQPSALTQQLGRRLDDGDVVPPGQVRRLTLVYDMPALPGGWVIRGDDQFTAPQDICMD